MVAVSSLQLGALIEVDMVAVLDQVDTDSPAT
jgi:hypothetical protein